VEAFRGGRIAFTAIVDSIAAVLREHENGNVVSVDDVLAAETWARIRAREIIGTRGT
jgi:1-deoxy-D-xylulose-5-phosphate reductoisomerase